jgi:hypothetical protein
MTTGKGDVMKGVIKGRRGSNRGTWIPLLAAAVLVLSVAAVTTAGATEAPSRSEYVARLEGICKPGAEATQVAMRGAKGDLKAERLAVAASKFGKAATIFGGTVKTISAVPRPGADAAKLDTWFTYLNRQESYLKQITAQLRAGRAIPAQRLTARFIHNGNLANNSVIAFGFNYCSFKFSRYG